MNATTRACSLVSIVNEMTAYPTFTTTGKLCWLTFWQIAQTEDGGFFVAGALLILLSLAVAAFLCSLISLLPLCYACRSHSSFIALPLVRFFSCSTSISHLDPFFTLFSFPCFFFLFFASSRFYAPCKNLIFLLLLIELGLQLCAFCLS